ncbi:MAG: hypothetical protein K0R00_2679 [Herbinix sp.]|nr:hypothetical protein [Herbinix sp.]
MRAPINLLIVIIFVAGIIWLQVFLAKKENKILGLILPFISFAYSLLNVFSIHIVDNMTTWEVCKLIATTLIILNIPTLILGAIYWSYRGNASRKRNLEKMNIQDLE